MMEVKKSKEHRVDVRPILILIFVSVFFLSIAADSTALIISQTYEEPKREIEVINQTGIDVNIEWEFTEVTPDYWLARGTINDRKIAADAFRDYPIVSTKDITVYSPVVDIDKKEITFALQFPGGWKDGLTMKFGFASTIINTTTDNGEGYDYSWGKRVYYDEVNDRWHVTFIDNGQIRSMSAPASDATNWTVGTVISSTDSYDYDSYTCALDYDGSTTYLHCAITRDTTAILQYKRCELTGVSPYITCGAEYTIYDASAQGGEATDDIGNPHIAIDEDDCALIAFDFEDDSLGFGDAHQVSLIKENISDGCGDGVWYYENGTESGFPIFGIQPVVGYQNNIEIGLVTYGDDDAELLFVDGDGIFSTTVYSSFFDGDLNTVYDPRILVTPAEYSFGFTDFTTSRNGLNMLTGALPDGGTYYHVYTTVEKNGSLSTDGDTGLIPVNGGADEFGKCTSVTNTNSSNVWFFCVYKNDYKDIYYSITDNNGTHWINTTKWIDDGGTERLRYLDAAYNPDDCQILLSWVDGDTGTINVTVESINVSCEPTAIIPGDPPVSVLHAPENRSTDDDGQLTLVCNVSDDVGIFNTTFYTNLTGTWGPTYTNTTTGINLQISYNSTLEIDNTLEWNCYACDKADQCTFYGINWTVGYYTPPPIATRAWCDGDYLYSWTVENVTENGNETFTIKEEIFYCQYGCGEGTYAHGDECFQSPLLTVTLGFILIIGFIVGIFTIPYILKKKRGR